MSTAVTADVRTPEQDVDWWHRAACRDENPELFFPAGTTGAALLDIEEAKRICRRCDVRGKCLGAAVEKGETNGVWGAVDFGDPQERANARRRYKNRGKILGAQR